jgi:ribosome recycling factor
MNEEVELVLSELEEQLNKSIAHVKGEFAKLRAGKASPSMLSSVEVEYYGSPVPISQVANVNTPDARTILIQPWEKTLLPDIEKAIINSNIGLNPQNDGENIFINVPPLTEERRKTLVKQVKSESENGRIGLRAARKDANEMIKSLQKDGLSEDDAKRAEDNVQDMVDSYNKKIDQLVEEKEAEIMTI